MLKSIKGYTVHLGVNSFLFYLFSIYQTQSCQEAAGKSQINFLYRVFPTDNRGHYSCFNTHFNWVLSLVGRKVWNQCFPYQTKQVINSHSGTIPYHQNTQRMLSSLKVNALLPKSRAGVSGSYLLFYYTSIHLLLSETPIIKHKKPIMLIFRLACMLGVPPHSPYRWLPFILEFQVATVHLVLIT